MGVTGGEHHCTPMTDLLLNEAFGSLTQVPRDVVIARSYVDTTSTLWSVADDAVKQALWSGEYKYATYDGFTSEPEKPHNIASIAVGLPSFTILRGVQSPHRSACYLVRGNDWMASVVIQSTNLYIECVTHAAERGTEIVSTFREKLLFRKSSPDVVTYQVWSGEEYPSQQSFESGPVKWEKVKENYPRQTRQALEQLATLSRSPKSSEGKLVLLHGVPGTGKTTAIRMLLESWRSWKAQPILILDPEVMLASPKYLMRVMDSVDEEGVRVIIIEDADEICSKNGPRGSSMSRLLQMLDGLVGASKPVLVLMTTNAAPNELDSALTRVGRCAAAVEFVPFTPNEAAERLGGSNGVSGPMTLADIYHQMGETSIITNQTSAAYGQYL
jgi:ATPase family associated with various cellular activities (AAA)